MKKYIFSVILLSLFTPALLAQNQVSPGKKQFVEDQIYGAQVFMYDVYYFMSSTDKAMTSVHIHIGFCNDILQFVKETNDRYRARYELVIAIFDKRGNQLSGRTMNNDIVVTSFSTTNLRKITNRLVHTAELVADEYKLIIELIDLDTKKSLRKEKSILVKGFQLGKLGLSSIVLTDSLYHDSLTLKEITPNLTKNFTDPQSNFGTYVEIYPLSTQDPLIITYSVIETNNMQIFSDEETFIPQQYVVSKIFNLKNRIDKAKRYVFRIAAEQCGIKTKVEEKFSTNWSYFESKNLNIEQALIPLRDFISVREWKWLEQTADSTKERWLSDYWKQRDPTPGDDKNELKEEFYDRIDFANSHFLVNTIDKDGWETDRGKIYIKYGAPTHIERHSSELNVPPYEIWYYAHIERRFIFEDRSRDGDYTLVKIE